MVILIAEYIPFVTGLLQMLVLSLFPLLIVSTSFLSSAQTLPSVLLYSSIVFLWIFFPTSSFQIFSFTSRTS